MQSNWTKGEAGQEQGRARPGKKGRWSASSPRLAPRRYNSRQAGQGGLPLPLPAHAPESSSSVPGVPARHSPRGAQGHFGGGRPGRTNGCVSASVLRSSGLPALHHGRRPRAAPRRPPPGAVPSTPARARGGQGRGTDGAGGGGRRRYLETKSLSQGRMSCPAPGPPRPPGQDARLPGGFWPRCRGWGRSGRARELAGLPDHAVSGGVMARRKEGRGRALRGIDIDRGRRAGSSAETDRSANPSRLP